MGVSARRSIPIRKLAATVVCALTLAGAGASEPARGFLCSACSFLQYYRAIGDASVPAGFFERVAMSLALARSDAHGRIEGRGEGVL
jgi:hypothetical protein